MKIHDVVQGSKEWLQARLGVVTASRADLLVTPKTLKASAQAEGYLNQLVAELRIGKPAEDLASSPWMERGTDLEAHARQWYGSLRGEVEIVGFVTTHGGRIGCSPDGLVGDDGGVEIKCPAARTMIGYLRDPGAFRLKYRGQVQLSLWVTKRAWWDLLAWNPSRRIPNVLFRETPDETYQAALDKILPPFAARVAEVAAEINDMGPVVGMELDAADALFL